ncbi:hypothetical protein [Anaerolentibacter hominis]|uniref:hypothetical protein n=1 Tax=Anaerolentibacter hominis TaxID=3079009 RepID=UPI0031B868BC
MSQMEKYAKGNNFPYGFYCFYGNDIADMEDDWLYFKSMLPLHLRDLQSCIENECDKLEFAGSVIFDEYPDKVTILGIVKTVIGNCGTTEDAAYPDELVTSMLLNELVYRRFRYRHHQMRNNYLRQA